MLETQSSPVADAARGPGPMPAYRVVRDFFDEGMVSKLLEHAVVHESEFNPTALNGGIIDSSIRVSSRLRGFGRLEEEVRRQALDLAPALMAELRVPIFAPSRIELEMVAHGDGAFFKRHVDTRIGSSLDEVTTQRILSGVYYFHTRPRRFSGGALRLYAFGADETSANFVDLEPEWNTLVVFPSWAAHEVLHVGCPSGQFIDSRFAINCWFRKPTKGM